MIRATAQTACMTSTTSPVTLRPATAVDARELSDLAALDSRRVPSGDLVVAEREGRIVAAVAVESLDAIADPFRRTVADVVLLRQRAMAHRNARPARHFRLVPRAA